MPTPRRRKPHWVTHLLDWFAEHRRAMPWRDAPLPYPVWISEMMLQQTQVETVRPYFDRFMDQFPTVGPTLDYAEEKQIHQRMSSGDDLDDPDTGALVPGIQAISFFNFEALDDWQVAKTDTTNPEGLFCPYRVNILFDRGQQQAQMYAEGQVRFYAVAIDTLLGGEMQTYYLMSGQVDLTGNIFKGSENSSWGSVKAMYR